MVSRQVLPGRGRTQISEAEVGNSCQHLAQFSIRLKTGFSVSRMHF